MDELRRLQHCCAGSYRIDGAVGQGGMATVYRAHDLRHDRTVAIKVLRPELAAALGPDRFLQEIRLTAKLDHPHVLPLLDSGSADRLLFYVMPFVEGETLRDRLRRDGPLPVAAAVGIAREVADGLHHAHTRGIIHRDIKPENVLLADGHARVADFGIAKAVSSAGGGLTEVGVMLGTPQYMSPEVAAGEPADARSDVYQVGCLLYEMLAGGPPFVGDTAQSVMAKHVTHDVPSLRRSRPEVPAGVERVIRQALAKSPADRVPTAGALAEALAEATGGRHGSRLPPARVAIGVALAGAVVAGVLLWPTGTPEPQRVAVLPRPAAGSEAATYLEEGLAEALGMELMRLPDVTVVAHESARRLERSDPRSAARALRTNYLVLLSARRADRRVHVNVRMVDDQGVQRWAGRYDRDLQVPDVVAVQEDIARNVAREMRGLLGPFRMAPAQAAPTDDFGAYDLFMRGRYFWRRRGAENLRRAAADFEQAITADSTFAEGYIALAQTYLLFPSYGVHDPPPDSVLFLAETLVTAGLAIDSTMGEAHATRAMLLEYRQHDWPAARRAFERAIRLAPGAATAHQWFGEHLLVARDTAGALRAFRRAVELDPLSPAVSNALAIGLHVAGDQRAALRQVSRTVATDSSYVDAHFVAAAAHLALGDLDSVTPALVRAGVPAEAAGAIVGALGGGLPASAGAAAVRALEGHAWMGAVAAMYAALGARDDALRIMAQALATPGEDLTATFAPLPVFRPLEGDARYAAMLAALGLSAVE